MKKWLKTLWEDLLLYYSRIKNAIKTPKTKTKVTIRRRTVGEKKISTSSSAALGLRGKLEGLGIFRRLSYLDPVVEDFKKEVKVREDARIYDYTSFMWGHAFGRQKVLDQEKGLIEVIGHGSEREPLEGNHSLHIWAHHYTIREGDLLRLKVVSGVGDFLVTNITYKRDPEDMFEATLQFHEWISKNDEL